MPQARDRSGNLARPARRIIRLLCPRTEVMCTDGDGLPACTTLGVCGLPPDAAPTSFATRLNTLLVPTSTATTSSPIPTTSDVMAATSTAGATSTATTGTSPSSTTSSPTISLPSASAALQVAAAAATDPLAPVIALLGPSEVYVNQYGVYDRCRPMTPMQLPCDPGAEAYDSLDGSLDLYVHACGVPLHTTKPDQQLIPLPLACNFSTATPGTYPITYSVQNSLGYLASVTRTLLVRAVCPDGERLCADSTSCSVGGGVCVTEMLGAVAGSATSSASATTASAFSLIGSMGNNGASGGDGSSSLASMLASLANAALAAAVAGGGLEAAMLLAVPAAPPLPNVTLSLILTPSAPALVLLPRGKRYLPCATSGITVPTSITAPPCEPGAVANVTLGNVTQDITHRVVVCPPPECIAAASAAAAAAAAASGSSAMLTGCSADVLARHTLAAKGLAGCNINPLAPPGAVFHVDFWVWDDSRPAFNASARRTITITDPCTADPMTPHFCFNGVDDYVCMPTPCEAASVFLPPTTSGPTLQLLPSTTSNPSNSSNVVYVEYGTVPEIYLGPCVSADAAQSCGAVAFGVSLPTAPGRNATQVDLSSAIEVVSMTPCGSSGADACLACTLENLTVAGRCVPGVYSFQYSVTDELGRTASANRTVIVYQRECCMLRCWRSPVGLLYNTCRRAGFGRIPDALFGRQAGSVSSAPP